MTSIGVHLEGNDDLEAALAAVVAALQDPVTAEQTARLVMANAHPPVDRGTLAQSAQVIGPTLVYAAPYAVIVQARHPWLGAAISDTVAAMVAAYETAVQDAWT